MPPVYDRASLNLSEDEKNKLKPIIEEVVKDNGYTVQIESMDSKSLPFVLAQPEFEVKPEPKQLRNVRVTAIRRVHLGRETYGHSSGVICSLLLEVELSVHSSSNATE